MYNKLLTGFSWYRNRCLYDTFVKGIPEFFKWYDIRFEPQSTILTLDYPVLKDLSGYTGIDKIYEFIKCIEFEQQFLNRLPEAYIIQVLSESNDAYEDRIENIYELIALSVPGAFPVKYNG